MQRFSNNVLKRGLNFLISAAVVVCGLIKVSDAAAQPTNDNFVNATEIFDLWGSMTNNTATATAEAFEPSHAGFPPSGTIWYKWVAPKDGEVSLDTLGNPTDTVLAVYTLPVGEAWVVGLL